MLLFLLTGALVVFVAAQSVEMGLVIGLLATLGVGIFSLRRLDDVEFCNVK